MLPYGALAFTAISLAACAESTAPSATFNQIATAPAHSQGARQRIPDEYIVVFDDDVDDVSGRANALLKSSGGRLRAEYHRSLKGFAATMSAAAAARISTSPGVAFVEQDQVMSVTGTQSSAPWGLDRIDQAGLPLNGTYSYAGTGSGVNVYIVDTGIRRTHSQFGGRVIPAFSAIADGYGADGCHWHGTHVAGTVGGSSAGVAKSATLHSVRVLDCTGNGTTSTVMAGVEWVTANHRKPAVANVSISGGASSALDQAVQNSIATGVTYVVAAGNAASNACFYSPAAVPAAITVGATTNTDAQAMFSNWGSCLDLFAPGQAVLSAWNSDDYATGTASGTSMASPHVAGAAAIYLQSNPSASPAGVTQALLSSSTSSALSSLGSGSPNRLLRSGSGGGETIAPAPAPPPPPPPPPANAAPRASFEYSCHRSTCSFRSTSTDDLGIASYSWSLGDGSSSASANATHVYGAKGSYLVTLIVRDASGATGTAQRTIYIKNVSR